MNHNNAQPYTAYTQQQAVPYGYPAGAVPYPPPQQPPYPYTQQTQLPQGTPQQQQQQQNPHQQLQHHQLQQQQAQAQAQVHSSQSQQPPQQHFSQQFFQSLPPTTAAPQQTATPPQRQQHNPGGLQDGGPRSIPPTPGNGPGAPPAERNSPSEHNYEEDLMRALRKENENSNTADNNDTTMNADEDEDDEDEAMGEENEDEPVYQLPPPPEAIYPNEIELEKAMHAWSLEHGYELVRRASKRNAAKQLYKRYFHCSKHGKVSSKAVRKEDRKRVNRTSNRMGCPMSLAAVAVDPHDPSGNWQIRHRKTHHNHPAIEVVHLAGHRRRARNPAVERAVDGLFAMGTNVGDVLKFLQKTHPDGLFKRTDVANMKLKFKKYGTCAHHGDDAAEKQAGCNACKAKKMKCNNARPMCDVCTTSNTSCHYDTDPAGMGPDVTLDGDMSMISQNGEGPSSANQITSANSFPSLNMQDSRQAENILAALSSFQQEHVRPTRLTLESSAVEILASSTCGSGESYKSAVPTPFSMSGDYAAFKDAFLSAAMKENTSEVLTGAKPEPARPTGEEISIEEHNEYIKQLAIYKRRNNMLKAGLRETVNKVLWVRINRIPRAHDMWLAIEDLCMPRGSDQAFARFSDIHNVTLQGCGNLDVYIHQLESAWEHFNQMAFHHETRRAPAALNQSNAEILKRKSGGDGTFPEEMLCFVFLKNLGERHQAMAANLMKKHNVGGFGSGERLTFKELTMLVKRSLEPAPAARGAAVRKT